MPRIAATIAMVITVIACVVFNTVRYPATLAMLSGETHATQPDQSAETDSSDPTDEQATEPSPYNDTIDETTRRYESFRQANELTWKAEPDQPEYENAENGWDDSDDQSDPWAESDDSFAQDTSKTGDRDSDEYGFQDETDDWNSHESERATSEQEAWATSDSNRSAPSRPIHASASGRYAARLDNTGPSESFQRDEIERAPSDWSTSRERSRNKQPSWDSGDSTGREDLAGTVSIPRAARSDRDNQREAFENRGNQTPKVAGWTSATNYTPPGESWNARTGTNDSPKVRPLPPIDQISRAAPRSSYGSASTGQIPIYPSTAY